jgi:hypothetical protein
MSMGADHSPERHMNRFRRAHDLADRPAGDTAALLRKARAVFMLRARQSASESRWQVMEDGKALYRDKAARDLQAARLMHRLVMERIFADGSRLPARTTS